MLSTFFLFLFFADGSRQAASIEANPNDYPAYCYSGVITENKVLAFKEGAEGEFDGDVKRRSLASRAGPQNQTGSVLYFTASECTDQGDWASFPQQLLSNSPGFFTLRDQGICGDSYLVYDNGVLLGSTSDPGCTSPATCAVSCQFSRGCFYLEPGVTHNIVVTMGQSLYAPPAGVFVGYYAEAPGADCSRSDLTGPVTGLGGVQLDLWNNSCVLEPAYQGNVNCAPFGPYPVPLLCPVFQTE